MNQDQRKFLTDQVNKTFDKQRDDLKRRIPVKPSLNNHLIAAFLDNSIEFNDMPALKKKMRESVLKMGTGDVLIEHTSRAFHNRTRNKWGEDEEENYCKIPPEDLFIIPQGYIDALRVYEEERDRIGREIAILENNRDTIIMKIQIGSNQVLDKLITQVDNLADLNIMNSQFLLDHNPQKEITR
jgi:hypothetical protein